MRILIVTPPLVGHISPLLGVAAELEARGHLIAWADIAGFQRRLLPPTATSYPCRSGWPDDLAPSRPDNLKGPAALKFLWEDIFVPLARGMADDLAEAAQDFRAELLLVDQQALAGAIVAERLGLPWVSSLSTMDELLNPLAELPKVAQWRATLFAELAEELGLPDGVIGPAGPPHNSPFNPLFSPLLSLAYGIAGLFQRGPLPSTPIDFVGPVFRPNTGGEAAERFIDFAREAEGPTALLALGTANVEAGERFLKTAAEGLTEAGISTIVADPSGVLTGFESECLLSAPFLPQRELLRHVDVFITHSGYNSVCESIWHGVPMVLAGIRDDQPLIAQNAAEHGLGIAVRFSRASGAQIAEATAQVLAEPSYAEKVELYAEKFHCAGGAAAAADALEGLRLGELQTAQSNSAPSSGSIHDQNPTV
ncbi:glycosyltransferase [Psychromicrobium lacuslunae]|uniref:glycosyltransferase n=1 Tax=Psychromicrobium lacuslunae TaxID=1618207 RepID=UPI0005D3D67A|nr:glycosyltransferase [Psychromicrobium lacuslunae]